MPDRRRGTSQAVAERRAAALRMRREGHSYDDVAAAVPGYKSVAHARKDVSRALRRIVHEEGKALLGLERDRLDALQAQAWRILTSTDATDRDRVYAIRETTRVLERRARLLGLDRPAAERVKATEAEGVERTKTAMAAFFDAIENGTPSDQ